MRKLTLLLTLVSALAVLPVTAATTHQHTRHTQSRRHVAARRVSTSHRALNRSFYVRPASYNTSSRAGSSYRGQGTSEVYGFYAPEGRNTGNLYKETPATPAPSGKPSTINVVPPPPANETNTNPVRPYLPARPVRISAGPSVKRQQTRTPIIIEGSPSQR